MALLFLLVLAGTELVFFYIYISSHGVNHPKEHQGKKESRIFGMSLPFYTQTVAKQLEGSEVGRVLIHPFHSLSVPYEHLNCAGQKGKNSTKNCI